MKRSVFLLLLAACSSSETPAVEPGRQPLAGPRERPLQGATPLPDAPFWQETNHLPLLGSPDRVEMVGIVWPPDRFGSQWARPLPIVAGGGVRAADAPRTLALPGPVVAAAVTPERLVLATRNALHWIDASGAMTTTATTATIIDVRGTPDDAVVLVRTASGTLAYNERDRTFLALPVELLTYAGDRACSIYRGRLACGARGGPDPTSVAGEVPASIGRPIDILFDVTVPEALDVVLVGENGMAGVRGNAFVDVPLFAPDRVPYRGARSATRLDDGGFVVATRAGAMRILDRDIGPEWRVYNADRWILDRDVRGVAARGRDLWLASKGGLSRVTAEETTLENKLGAPFVSRIVERHNRRGAVADSHLTVRGDLSTNIPWDSDNDGSWTYYWLTGECYRHLVTGDPAARAHFDEALDGMLRLRDVSGMDHFVARAVIEKEGCRLDDCDDPDDGEWFTSPDGKWWVKADTSNDEVAAHVAMMGPAYDLCANDAQKQRIREHIAGIVGGIVDHGWQLVDRDGLVTTYGQYDPAYAIDSVPGALGDGGLRALQLLAALTLAHYLTGEDRFYEAKREVMDRHDYHRMAERELEYEFRRAHMDNDEMAVWSWMVLLRYESDPALYERWKGAWEGNWAKKYALEQAAWWTFAHAHNGGSAPTLFDARRWLRLVPVDMIRWNVVNSNRHDLVPAPAVYFDPVGRQRSDGRIIPYDERPADRWNTDQFKPDSDWFDGMHEMDGADAYAPYWMARHYGWITPGE